MGGRDCNYNLNFDSDFYGKYDDEYIHSLPSSLRLPKERKSGRKLRGVGDCYDPTEGTIYPINKINRKAQSTLELRNRFTPLENCEEQEDTPKRKRRGSESPERKKLKLVCFENFQEFCDKNSDLIVSKLFDNSICVTFNNKNNLCSGYFPDFISIPQVVSCVDNRVDNDALTGGPLDSATDFNQYYPFILNNKHLKQISNANSKYNNNYFGNLKFEYKVCKKFWGPPKRDMYKKSSNFKSKNKSGDFIGNKGYDVTANSSEVRTNSLEVKTIKDKNIDKIPDDLLTNRDFLNSKFSYKNSKHRFSNEFSNNNFSRTNFLENSLNFVNNNSSKNKVSNNNSTNKNFSNNIFSNIILDNTSSNIPGNLINTNETLGMIRGDPKTGAIPKNRGMYGCTLKKAGIDCEGTAKYPGKMDKGNLCLVGGKNYKIGNNKYSNHRYNNKCNNSIGKYGSSSKNNINTFGYINNNNNNINNSVGKYNNSSQNCISKLGNNNNKNNIINSNEGNTQFPSRSKSELSDQQSGFQNNSSKPKISISKVTNNNNLNNSHIKNVVNSGIGNVRFPLNMIPDQQDQESGLISGAVKQFPSPNHRGTQNCLNSKNVGTKDEVLKYSTPQRHVKVLPKKRLFKEYKPQGGDLPEPTHDIVPIETDLEVLLINSGKIDAMKVQTIVNSFMKDKNYASIFCLTETKVKRLDFQPEGIRLITKHRGENDKKGGGLAIGFDVKADVKLEEIDSGSNDILAVEGKVNNARCRIVLCYFDCTKQVKGDDYERNRIIQKKVEHLIKVDPNTALMVLGDINGRLTELEPDIKTDVNGKMVKSWIDKEDLHHLNALDTCVGRYTFESLNGKSAIDHILTNDYMKRRYMGMWIDEERVMLDISDHNLVRAWFRMKEDKYKIKKRKPKKEITWISRKAECLQKCLESFKRKVGRKHSFKGCINKLKTSVEHTMRKSVKKKPGNKDQPIRAAPWVDRELTENIELRSKLSRHWRYARKEGNKEKIERCKEAYFEQKKRTMDLAMRKKACWEEKMIAETENNPQAFWKMIKVVTGKRKEEDEEAFIFDEEGERKEIMECKSEFIVDWKEQVYQKLRKADFTFWYEENEGVKAKMIQQMEEENSGIMENPVISEEEFIKTINDMKNNKATGVDNIPAELMKVLIKDEEVRMYLLRCFNKALTEEVHKDWLISRTKMIPKNEKPKILEHRPIAVTVNSNKIICTILRQKIEDFLEKSGVKYENQFGFTQGGRVEHCLFMLSYIATKTYQKRGKRGKNLYFAFIDFKKAYDSIDRRKLIEVLVEFKINPQIIELIVQMYKNDRTVIKLGSMEQEVEVTGGIRQGCCLSTLLFKMVTFKIIDELRKEKLYKMGEFNDNSIWLADDATLIADSMQTLKKLLECLSKAGGKYGLQINEKKTKIMSVRGQMNDSMLSEYEKVDEATYLGVTVGGKYSNIFEIENKKVLRKADKKVFSTMEEVNKSANKALVGKAIWKQIKVPSILSGRAVVPTCNTLAEKLQRKENKVWRHAMGIGGYSTIAGLRGEIGASLMKTRVMKATLQYARDVMNGEFENIKRMMEDIFRMRKGEWYRVVDSYLQELKIDWKTLCSMTKEGINRMMLEYDTEKWIIDLEEKSTLKYYRRGKANMGYENCYRNNAESMLYAQARINALKLEEAVGRGQRYYDQTCKLCGLEREDLLHFMLKCPKLEKRRNREILDNGVEDPEEKLVHFLFRQENHQEKGRMIKEMWYARRSILRFKRECQDRDRQNGENKNLQKTDPGPRRYVDMLNRGRRGVSELRG